jgi:hypothetical protein
MCFHNELRAWPRPLRPRRAWPCVARARMPLLLDRADIKSWLTGASGTELLNPANEDRLRMRPVSRRINRTGGGDDAALVTEITR